MLKKIEIHVYETKKDYFGRVSEADKLFRDLYREIEQAGFRGVAPIDMVIDLSCMALHLSHVDGILTHGGIINKGTKIFVWK